MNFSLDSVLAFILYLAPGFLAIEVYNRIIPLRELREFRRVAWSMIIGVLIFFPVRRIFIQNNGADFDGSFPPVEMIVVLMVLGVILGVAVAGFRYLRYWLSDFEKLKWIAPDPNSVWGKVNEPWNKNWAVVFLQDGSIYLG